MVIGRRARVRAQQTRGTLKAKSKKNREINIEELQREKIQNTVQNNKGKAATMDMDYYNTLTSLHPVVARTPLLNVM